MALRNVTSKDPRKPTIVAALRRKSGDPAASRVTLLKEDTKDGTFTGRVLKSDGNRCFDSVGDADGFFTVTPAECGLEESR
jgi:hypothetical protein